MEDRILVSYLYDFYSLLLTEKKRNIFEMYYFNDFSLNEIAMENNITKQAVRDSLVKTVDMLKNYESKLMLYDKFSKRNIRLEMLCDIIDDLPVSSGTKNDILDIVKSIE